MSEQHTDQRQQNEFEDDAGVDNMSQASTDHYLDHEPFETYQGKVLKLCHLLWSEHPAEGFSIERLRGGSSNRIIGIRVTDAGGRPSGHSDLGTTSHPNPSQPASKCALIDSDSSVAAKPRQETALPETSDKQSENLNLPSGNYILRVPRWGSQNFEHEIAMLRLVKRSVAVDVPLAIHFDITNGDSNPLGSPYVLQHRVPGERLDDVWCKLNHTQRLLIGLDLARLYIQLMKITNTSGGIPDFKQPPTADGMLKTYDYEFPSDNTESKNVIIPQPPVDMLCERLARWGRDYPNANGDSPYYGAIEMVRHMQATNGTFESTGPLYYLNHGDLFPRNIMVELPTQNSAFVSGVLDWDDAHFAPAVVSFAPPAWLWVTAFWKDYDDEGFLDEQDIWEVAGAEPEDETSKEIKNLFDMAVGNKFSHHAYSPDAKVARKIWKAAYETIGKSWIEKDVERMYESWKVVQGRVD
ncbi:hypothetical protein F5B20DRAFT_593032 [Whalleya microplaca]|nr:hypothetical protein F5B20DRAFT_593032 [Whalleya microplaca]